MAFVFAFRGEVPDVDMAGPGLPRGAAAFLGATVFGRQGEDTRALPPVVMAVDDDGY